MLEQTSRGFRTLFLLEFTKEIIRNTRAYRDTRIKKEVKKILYRKKQPVEIPRKINIPQVVHEKIKEEAEKIQQLKKTEAWQEFKFKQKPLPKLQPLISVSKFEKRRGYIKIPETRLPETVSYLKPMPTSQYISLEKLDSLVNDPMVKTIECNGPDEKIVVTGLMGRKNTAVALTREEIDNVIARFSEASRIPVFEGIFKVVFGRLLLTTIISEVANPRFIITKLSEIRAPPAPSFG